MSHIVFFRKGLYNDLVIFVHGKQNRSSQTLHSTCSCSNSREVSHFGQVLLPILALLANLVLIIGVDVCMISMMIEEVNVYDSDRRLSRIKIYRNCIK